MNILFVIPAGSHSGCGKQLTLIAAGLPRDRFTVHVVVLGRDGPLVARLRSAGLAVEVLGWTRFLDPQPIRRLRQRVRSFRPDVLAGWGLAALRIGNLIHDSARLILHQLLPPRERHTWLPLTRFDRWLLRRADRVMAGHPAEAQAYRRLGMTAEAVCLLPPGVAPVAAPLSPRDKLLQGLALPSGARVLVCAGPLHAHKGFRDALWALDILKYLYEDLHLVVLGAGPERARLEDFARAIQVQDRTHFLGEREDVADWLAAAEVVWVPSRADRGINVTLEAMSVGRPVLAGRTPGLAEVVVDGETGYLIPPGDKVSLARLTRRLLDDPGLRRRLGDAGQKRAEERFAATELVRQWIDVVEGMFGPKELP